MTIRPSRGFSLIEILVALAVIAIALSASITAVSGTSNTLSHVESKRLAGWVAQNHLNSLRLMRAWPSRPQRAIKAELAGRQWRVEEVISQTSEEDMRRIDVKVWSMDSAAGTPLIVVSGFLPNPRLVDDD